MKSSILKISFICLLLSLMGVGCKKEHDSEQQNINITLYDQPLSVIQKYITGNWKLQYQIGGIAGSKYVDTHNSYMNLTPGHIIIGNDLNGVFVDSSIKWTNKYNSYLLDYSYSEGVHFAYIIERIKNDTLIITDDLGDGFTYYYTKH